MQIQRLFEIVYILLYKKKVTAQELAERFEVSTRTIYRDLDTLSAAGIPVYATKGRGGGILLLDNFVLNRSLLSGDEQKEILFALHGINVVSQDSLATTLERMRTLFHQEEQDWISIDLSDFSDIRKEMVNKLKQAIWNHHVIHIDYHSTYGELSSRDVYPYQLKFKDHSWYVKAFCTQKQAMRLFKINRIVKLDVLHHTFEPIQLIRDEKTIDMRNVKKETLVLKISVTMAYRVYDEFEESSIDKQEDGSFIVTVQYPYDSWVVSFTLSFGSSCTVLSPTYVKEDIKKQLHDAMNLY